MVLLQAFQDWYCPNCSASARTRPLPPNQSEYHGCPGLHGLNAPLIRAEVKAAVIARQRDDYLNGEIQATGDDSKPYMSIITLRDDGYDTIANAGLAQGWIRV